MSNLFEVTGDDVARLGDADLRTLIGLLCEADYRQSGLPTRGITWGGNQNARDGGLDVVVRDEATPPSTSFVLRKISGFQVKKSDMPRAEILKEMRPGGILREEIKELIKTNGAYIIVSSAGSTSESALRNRIAAMKEAVADEENHQNIHLDFIDRGRVATWVRSHPSLILWVRNKVGRALFGWRPYENWADAQGVEEEYLVDGGLRLHDGTKTTVKALSAGEGLLRLRSALSVAGASVRLTGLSGVGKTRFVQALFDQRIGDKALNPFQAVYTDISDKPLPDPQAMATQLIANRTRAILIVDNCPPDLHRKLTQVCSKPESTASLLTVEYDVRDDLPEETAVFRLEPASEEIIEKLIGRRFKHISQVDSRTIATFSGGNARVAIALANTVLHGETLSGFRNEELFERLFWQRHDPDKSLLVSAEACSLVYSFEGTDVNSEKSEIQFLASFINKSGAVLYGDIAELKRRGLIQSRGVWRALLPHAIANRLARRALESIPKDILMQGFLQGGSERLIRSFTRRLSYLHECETAVSIVSDWLNQNGWIGESIGNLNSLGIDVLKNIAPVAPEKTLAAIESAANGSEGGSFTSRENPHHSEFARVLRHLAYDPSLFERSVKLLCRFALSESKGENRDSTRDVLNSLFYIHLSGTHAPVEARARIIEELVGSEDLNNQELGILLLDSALESWDFSSSYEFSFGARPRDYGYYPRTGEEISRWFSAFIGICTRLALSGQPISGQARKLLSNNLRGLWRNAGMFDVLEESARQIQGQRAWNDGWIAVRGIIRYDSKGFNEEIKERTLRLERLLRPPDLLEQARTFALSDQHGSFDLEDDFDDHEDASAAWTRVEETTRKIGAQVAQCLDILNVLLPDLVSVHSSRSHIFGRGLAEGDRDKQELFKMLRTGLEKTPPEKRGIGVIRGFLSSCAESDPSFYNTTLDELVDDDVLGEWFPILQTASTIDERGVNRLHKALDIGKAKVQTFQYLAWGRAHEPISDDELARLLRKILSKEGGFDVAIEIINMRAHARRKNSQKWSESLIEVAREILSTYFFNVERGRVPNADFHLSEIAGICISGQEGIPAAEKISLQLAKAINDHRIYAFDYPHLLNRLAQAQPRVFLDVFLGDKDIEVYQRRRMFPNNFERHDNPLNQIPDIELLSWCEEDPHSRFPIVASAVEAFKKSDQTGEYDWKPIVYAILERAPDLTAVLEQLAEKIRPMSWSGSLSSILKDRSVLYQKLFVHDNTIIQAWAKSQLLRLKEAIRKEAEWEDQRHRERFETFE
jgi:hypothetical protein